MNKESRHAFVGALRRMSTKFKSRCHFAILMLHVLAVWGVDETCVAFHQPRLSPSRWPCWVVPIHRLQVREAPRDLPVPPGREVKRATLALSVPRVTRAWRDLPAPLVRRG
jgi:hypothetical protein